MSHGGNWAARPVGRTEAASVVEERSLGGDKRPLEICSAFAAECERIATMDDLARGVCALVAPFGYHCVASGRLGHSDAPETFHFANWTPGWLEFYIARGFLRIDPVPLWALACGRPIGATELRA